jgi:hypothetical protein
MGILGLSSLFYSHKHLSIAGYIIVALFVVYMFFCLVLIQPIRHQLAQHRFTVAKQILTPTGLQQSVSKIIATEDSPSKHIQIVTQPQKDGNLDFHVEKSLLQSSNYGWSVSREIAWTMLYFGHHKEYLGCFYSLKDVFDCYLPGRLHKDRLNIGRIIFEERGIKFAGTAPGPLGEGYACYGYIGAYSHWIIWAFLCGLMAKFSIIHLFTDSSQFELTTVNLFIATGIPLLLCAGFYLFVKPLGGFVLIFIVLTIIRYISNNFLITKTKYQQELR